MEKKKYIAPECEVIEMVYESAILSASNPTLKPDVDEDDIVLQSNRYRGEWGNLWADKTK